MVKPNPPYFKKPWPTYYFLHRLSCFALLCFLWLCERKTAMVISDQYHNVIVLLALWQLDLELNYLPKKKKKKFVCSYCLLKALLRCHIDNHPRGTCHVNPQKIEKNTNTMFDGLCLFGLFFYIIIFYYMKTKTNSILGEATVYNFFWTYVFFKTKSNSYFKIVILRPFILCIRLNCLFMLLLLLQ